MSYVERVLQPGETVSETTRIHWWFVWRRTLLLLVLGVAFAAVAASQTGALQDGFLAGTGVAALLGLVLAIGPAIERATTELAVTNRRIIHKRGLIQRHTIEISRSQVESVDVDQSVLGRLLNFGDITVHGTGTTPEPFHFIADPIRFRSAITAS